MSADFAVKETSPKLVAGLVTEHRYYLYVKVAKGKDLAGKDGSSGVCEPYVEIRVGNNKRFTKHMDMERQPNPEWNQVFGFLKDRIQSSIFEVAVKDHKDVDFIGGKISFDFNKTPLRVPPSSPLTPQWYRLEEDQKPRGELMLAVWWGSQTDEAFAQAWLSEAASVRAISNIWSKEYLSPDLWYVRVNVIEARDLMMMKTTTTTTTTDDDDKRSSSRPQVYVKAVLGNQVLSTKASQNLTNNPIWNEELLFVVAEPFHEPLMLSVEDKSANYRDQNLGKLVIPLKFVQRRLDYNSDIVNSQWYNLEKQSAASRIHLRLCLEGGYHVLDEPIDFTSDLRPAAEQLRRKASSSRIGILEVGILGASELILTKTKDGRGTTDAYCVAKYGHKWFRTRTIPDSILPSWNEQYTWEVFDLCTVITVGVFDNGHLHGGTKDAIIGKVRIRLSTLEANRVYTFSYPLLSLHQYSGVRKTGEIHLAVRFKSKSSSSLIKMMHMYSKPLLPEMHYLHPLSKLEQDSLRQQAMQIVSTKLSRADPPLSKEVVEYMLGVDSQRWWSLRRSKANISRIMGVISGLIALKKWFDQICSWRNTFATLMVHVLFIILLLCPTLILPAGFLYLFLKGMWNYVTWKRQHPTHIDIGLSHADAALPDELDEEFDTFPTSRPSDIVKMRYDRLRTILGRVQTAIGDLAVQGEKIEALLRWRDPGATILFATFSLIASVLVYVIPFRVVALLTIIYVLRHPKYRYKLSSVPVNFFRRLPENYWLQDQTEPNELLNWFFS